MVETLRTTEKPARKVVVRPKTLSSRRVSQKR
jgi:hypothetical protein